MVKRTRYEAPHYVVFSGICLSQIRKMKRNLAEPGWLRQCRDEAKCWTGGVKPPAGE
jgi:hypothetical protein